MASSLMGLPRKYYIISNFLPHKNPSVRKNRLGLSKRKMSVDNSVMLIAYPPAVENILFLNAAQIQ